MNTNTNTNEALLAIADTLSKAVEQLRLLVVPPKTLTITFTDCTHTYVNHLFNDCFVVQSLSVPMNKSYFEELVHGKSSDSPLNFLKYLLNDLEALCTPEFYQKIFSECRKIINDTRPQTTKLFSNGACIPSYTMFSEQMESLGECKFSQEDKVLYNCLRQVIVENKEISQMMYNILKRNVPEKMFDLFKLI